MNSKLLFSFLIFFFASLVFASAQVPTLSNGLNTYFNLDEPSGSNAINQVNSLPEGIPQSGTVWGVPGVMNNAYSFLGGGDGLVLNPTSGACMLDNICTISLWVKYTPTLARAIWYQGSNNGQNLHDSVGLYVLDSAWMGGFPGSVTLQVRNSAGVPEYVISPITTSDDNWHQVVAVGNGSSYLLYIDGNFVNQKAIVTIPQEVSPVEMFGDRPGGDNWNGQIDEIGLWNRALSTAEVSQLYNNGAGMGFGNFSTPPPQAPVLAPVGPQTILENQTLSIQLQATDPNIEDNLTYLTNAKTVLPTYAYLDANTGLFTWTPSFQDQGFYNVTFYVTDGQFIDSETVQIQVQDVSLATITVNSTALLGGQTVFNLHDPLNANTPYVFGGSFDSSPGIALGDGRVLQLNNDWLFNALFYVPQLFGFSGTSGVLDSQGNAQVVWNIPSIPGASGINLKFAFATLDSGGYTGSPQSVLSISPAVNVALTDSQQPPTNNTNNTLPLVALWHFDENNGITTLDSSGNGNHGTINGATWTNDSISGYALEFDGTNDFVSTTHTPSIDLVNNVSIEAWVKRNALGYGTVVSKNGPYFLAIYNNKIRGGVYTNDGLPGGNTWTEVTGITDLQVGNWYKLEMTYNGSEVRVLVNDVIESSYPKTGQMPQVSQDLFIGWGEPGQNYHFNGLIDEVTIRGY